MKRIVVSAGMTAIIIRMLDGYKDDQVSCKYVDKKGINCVFEVETEMTGDEAASYIKKVIKKMPEGVSLYFSVKPE